MFLVSVLRKVGLIFCILLGASIPTVAAPDIPGEYKQVHSGTTNSVRNELVDNAKFSDRGENRYWTYSFSSPPGNSRYTRIRFDQIRVPPGLTFSVRVVQLPAGSKVAHIPAEMFGASDTFVTELLPAGDLRIELVSNAAPAGLSFRLERLLWQTAPPLAVAESPVFTYRPVQSLPAAHPAVRAASSVALLHVGPTDVTCTGALIDAKTVLTNYHCVQYSLSFLQSEASPNPSCADIVVEFDYLTRNQHGASSKCLAIRTDKALDAALITLDPARIKLSSGADRLPIAIRPAAEGPPGAVSLLQHPVGLPMSLIDGCSNKGVEGIDILHDCLSSSGSSGSPLLDEKMQLAGLHYKGAYPDDWTGIQMINDLAANGPRYNRARSGVEVARFLNP
ncbi:MAG: trypsin-like peptidase domain-containing protein [bacterium]|nr:trypsin-like peptidase domain-containing protein [bacterium]